jgi:hypothetical protein
MLRRLFAQADQAAEARGQQADSLDRALTRLLLMVTVLVSTAVGAYLGRKQLSNSFLHYDIAFTETARGAEHVEFLDRGSLSGARYARGRQLWMIAVGELLGLQSQVPLQFMPIGSALLSVAYFAVFKRFLGSSVVAAAMTLHQMVNPSQLLGLYSTFAYGLGMTLYLGILLLVVRTLDDRHPVEVLLLFVLATAINLVHYALTVWVILTAVIVNVWMWLSRRRLTEPDARRDARQFLPLALFMIVVFLGFNEVVYDSYLPHLGDSDGLGGGWAIFFNRLPWVRIEVGEAVYEFSYQRSNLISVLSTLHLCLILVPVVLGVSLRGAATIRGRATCSLSTAGLAVWSLLPVGVIDTLIYALRGNIGVKYFILVYPVATIWFLKEIGGKRLAIVGLIGLLGLSTARLAVELREGHLALSPLSYSEARTVTSWYHEHTAGPDAVVLSDLNLYGKLLVEGATYDHQPGLLVITPQVYDWLLGRNSAQVQDVGRCDYLVLDVGSSAPLMTPFWRSLEPLRSHRASITENDAAVKLYDDNFVWILQP